MINKILTATHLETIFFLQNLFYHVESPLLQPSIVKSFMKKKKKSDSMIDSVTL